MTKLAICISKGTVFLSPTNKQLLKRDFEKNGKRLFQYCISEKYPLADKFTEYSGWGLYTIQGGCFQRLLC